MTQKSNMVCKNSKLNSLIRILFIAAAVVSVNIGKSYSQGLKLEAPYIEGFHPLDQEPYEYSMLKADHPVLLTLKTNVFIDTAIIGFEKRQISFRRTDPLGFVLWDYHYGELSDYLASRRNYALINDWKRQSMDGIKADKTKSKNSVAKLEWELPVQYPSWAQRILGNEAPKLKIDGFAEIILGFGNNKKEQANNTNNNNNNFDLNLNYEISITGSIGRLINVNIKSSSQDQFNFSNSLDNFKIEYKESKPGELEDEIIQEVSAGATAFDMPGTSLTGYVEAKKGLFGIKVKSKFGPLTLTSIASTEHGEAKRTSKSLNSGGSETPVEVTQFCQNKFFYLNNLYRRLYIKKHGGTNSSAVQAPVVDSLQVWIKADDARQKRADAKGNIKNVYVDSVNGQLDPYEKLKKDIHYKLNADEGYIEFVDTVAIQSTDQIAIYMRVHQDTTLNKGKYVKVAGTDTLVPVLWTLKPENEIESADKDTSRYYLMWRNVYTMTKAEDLTNIKVSIFKKDPDDNTKQYEKNDSNVAYTSILGLADNSGKLLFDRPDIFNGEDGLIIIPPYSDTAKNADLPFTNPKLGKEADDTLYRFASDRLPDGYKAKFFIKRSSGSNGTKTNVFPLDFGIIPGTDRVTGDGVELIRDQDYVINYEMGQLELISLKAKSYNNIVADYQTQSAFVPDKKTFLGVHGELQMPFLSDNSFIGANVLYQNVKVNEDVPRLEQEPYSKVLYDFNTKIDLEPEWMTALVNKIPFITTAATSKATLEVEVAHSKMNPNSDGEAYIDDFEDSKISDQLVTSGDNWHQASPPFAKDTLDKVPPAWDYYWFSPEDWDNTFRVPRTDLVVPDPGERTTLSQEGSYSILRLHCRPAPSAAAASEYRSKYKNAWAGIMTPVPSSFRDKSKDQYFEFLVKSFDPKGKNSKLIIQMGEMREDLSLDGGPPNGRANKEDDSLHEVGYYNRKYDLGLDKLPDSLESWLVPSIRPGVQWDTLKYGDIRLGEFRFDPSRDNYKKYEENGKENYRYNCKLQDNSLLDAEDINLSGSVETSLAENYFQYTIDLSDTTAIYYDQDAKIPKNTGWHKVRIPIKDLLPNKEEINSPLWTNIRMVRLIWTDFDSTSLTDEHQLGLADIGFVGNQWINTSDTTVKVVASSVNNEDDYNYVSPIHLDKDPTTNKYEREQSLRINFSKLGKGKEAILWKNLQNQSLNLTAYKNLSLLVYGKESVGDQANRPIHNGDIQFVFRFGTDSTTYYEYKKEIMPQWNNAININLQQIAKMKDAYMISNPDSAIDSSNGSIAIHAPAGRQPNFANIQYMAIGVVRSANATFGGESDTGEIWVDEMKVNGIGDMSGWAARVNLSTKWADLFSINANMNYQNGNYRQMPDITKTPGDSKIDGSADASISLDKFLPKDWGVSLPVGGSVSGSVSRPQLKSNDVLLNENGKSDDLIDLLSDKKSESRYYGNENLSKRVYTSYDKSSTSKNPIAGLLADRISTNFTYSNNISKNFQGKAPSGDSGYVITDTTDTYTGSLKYDLSPKNPPKWTTWQPIKGDSVPKWVPNGLKDYKFSLLPTQFKFNLADANYSWHRNHDTKKHLDVNDRTFDMNHGFSMEYEPIDPLLKLSYNVTINRDLDSVAGKDHGSMANSVFSRYDDETWKDLLLLYGEKTRTQHAALTLNPKVVDWFSNTVDYSTDYTATMTKRQADVTDYMNAGVNVTLTYNTSLDLGTFFNQVFSNGKGPNDTTESVLSRGLKKMGLHAINFTYTAASVLKNNYLSPSFLENEQFSYWDLFKYEIGAKGRNFNDVLMGEMDDDDAFGGMRYRNDKTDKDLYKDDTRSVKRSYKFSTSLDLTFPFDISFNSINFGWSTEYLRKPDTSYFDSTYVFPDFSISANTNALMKVPFFANLMSNLALNSSYAYQKSFRFGLSNDTTMRSDWTPLISLSGTVKKWPINVNYNHKLSYEKKNLEASNSQKTINGDEVTISYEIQKNSRLSEIKIFSWTIPVRGKTSVGVTFTRTKTDEKSGTESLPKNLSLSFAPHLSYIFTDNVTGTVQWTYKSDESNETVNKDNLFQLIVRIQF